MEVLFIGFGGMLIGWILGSLVIYWSKKVNNLDVYDYQKEEGY